MKPNIITTMFFLAVVLAACAAPPASPMPAPTSTGSADENSIVKTMVEDFGKRLQTVSLLAPDAAQEMQKQYSEFVSPALLAIWTNEPLKAPGRLVSSPWPDRIEITALRMETHDRYVIDGYIVEISSTELNNGGAAHKIPVNIILEKDQSRWLITEFREEQ